MEDDGVLAVLIDEAGGDHLVDDAGRLLALLALLLELPDFDPQIEELLLVGNYMSLPVKLLLLVLLDLLAAAPPFRLALHHVGSGALALWKIE